MGRSFPVSVNALITTRPDYNTRAVPKRTAKIVCRFRDKPVDKKIEKLQAATRDVAFEHTLRSAANTVAYYGAVFTLVGVIFTVRFGLVSSWSTLTIGAALLGESFYIRWTRSPRALWLLE
jgi:hypothetical protein